MLPQLINYLIVLVIIGAHSTIGEIHPNEIQDGIDSFQGKKLLKDEYIPLNSITLEQFYNKKNPKHGLDPKKRNRWIKPKKKSRQKLKNQETDSGENKIDSKSPPTSSKSRSANIVPTTRKVRLKLVISLSNLAIY